MEKKIKIEQPPRVNRIDTKKVLREVSLVGYKRYKMTFREAAALRSLANIWKNRGDGEFSVKEAEECGVDVYDVIRISQ